MDIGLLLGIEYLPPFPPTVHEQALKATIDMVKYYKTGHLAIGALGEHPGVKTLNYLDQYARTRSMIRYSLILTSEGIVQPLPLAITHPPNHQSNAGGQNNSHHPHHATAADIPVDLHEIFTSRLPDEMYYYLSRGLLGPQALIWLTTGSIVESPPLDNGETTEYKRFIKEVITDGQTGPRATALALISNVAHSSWQNKKVFGSFWFDGSGGGQGGGGGNNNGGNKPIQHNAQQIVTLVERIGSWRVGSAVVEEELRRQNVSRFYNLHFFLSFILSLIFSRHFCLFSSVSLSPMTAELTFHPVLYDRLCPLSWRHGNRQARRTD
jgi:hypothetical protein